MRSDAGVENAFVQRPHRTVFRLSVPVFFSLIAEPITGLVDTHYVKELGADPLAALGVGTALLSAVFWIFNFLGTGTQTEIARAYGSNRREDGRSIASLAIVLCLGFGAVLAALAWMFGGAAVDRMEAASGVRADALRYIEIRALAAPAVLLMSACFGALRGVQDMRSTLFIAVFANVVNVVLDILLISGAGPIPALGVTGAAVATAIAQWMGAIWALVLVRQRIGLGTELHLRDAKRLLVVGFDLFLRTGLLTLFLLMTTRAATKISSEAGAAHQAIRNVWLLAALCLDAFAATAQSLTGYFHGAERPDLMRRVASVTCKQSFAMGVALALAMLASTSAVGALLVPPEALAVFASAWWLSAAFQPINALSFATDGIHLGTADYTYLRNAMLVSTTLGIGALLALEEAGQLTLGSVWGVTAAWIAVRSVFGMARIWPGSGVWRR